MAPPRPGSADAHVAGTGPSSNGTRPLRPDVALALPPAQPPKAAPRRHRSRLRAAARSWTTLPGIKARALLLLRGHALPPLRRALSQGRAGWVRHLPADLVRRFELDGGVVHPLRVEVGSGDAPTPGYVHVDSDRRARHIEHLAPASSLPFADGSVEELLAIHILEHVHASVLLPTLREWRRVLRPGGFAQIHVPDAATVFAAFLDKSPEEKWTLLVPIFGKTSHARDGQPEADDLERHHVIYDFALLEWVLLRAGFERVEDVSRDVTDRHTAKWRDDELLPRMSLVVRAHAA